MTPLHSEHLSIAHILLTIHYNDYVAAIKLRPNFTISLSKACAVRSRNRTCIEIHVEWECLLKKKLEENSLLAAHRLEYL